MPEWLAVLIAGGVGGLTRSLMTYEITWLYFYRNARRQRACHPGTVGTIAIGAVAGIAFWALYDATAAWATQATDVRVVFASLVAGITGGHFLQAQADKQLDDVTSAEMAQATGRLAELPTESKKVDTAKPGPHRGKRKH